MMTSALAVFGSQVRGDCDRWSDRDVLLVEDDPSVASSLKGRMRQAGWSCTHYTWDRLDKLSLSGSLFVQHLRQESIRLSDLDGRLSDLLSDFVPKHSYDQEIRGAGSLYSLLEGIPDSAEARLWALDVLAVLFRSLTIPTLANHGLYVFGHQQMITGLKKIGMVTNDQARNLYDLRKFKAAHRGRVLPAHEVEWGHVVKLVNIVDSAFRVGLEVKKVANDVVLGNLNKTSVSTDWYATSRSLELALMVTQTGHGYLERRKGQMLSLLRAPTQYGGYLAKNLSKLQNEVYNLVCEES